MGSYMIPGAQPGGIGNLSQAAQSSQLLKTLKLKQLYEPESLACLLVTLFVDDPRLHSARLQRILKNACSHPPTRDWLVRTLIGLVQRVAQQRASSSTAAISAQPSTLPALPPSSISVAPVAFTPSIPNGAVNVNLNVNGDAYPSNAADVTLTDPGDDLDRMAEMVHVMSANVNTGGNSWLGLNMETSLGTRTNIFQVQPASSSSALSLSPGPSKGRRPSSGAGARLTIHPQAAPTILKHALDLLVALNRSLSVYLNEENKSASSGGASATDSAHEPEGAAADFWELLLRLDSQQRASSSRFQPMDVDTPAPPSALQQAPFELLPLPQVLLSRRTETVDELFGGATMQLLKQINSETFLATYCNSSLANLIGLLDTSTVLRQSCALTDRLLKLLNQVTQSLEATQTHLEFRPQIAEASASPADAQQPATQASSSGKTDKLKKLSGSEGGDKKKRNVSLARQNAESFSLLFAHMELLVKVLTSRGCSAAGLEDVMTLLQQLGYAGPVTRQLITELLLRGVQELGSNVCYNIRQLSGELNEHLEHQKSAGGSGSPGRKRPFGALEQAGGMDSDDEQRGPNLRLHEGRLVDRFNPENVLVVNASGQRAHRGAELQLPAMAGFTGKTSNQNYLLRLLKAVIQLREHTARILTIQQAVTAPPPVGIAANPPPFAGAEQLAAAAQQLDLIFPPELAAAAAQIPLFMQQPLVNVDFANALLRNQEVAARLLAAPVPPGVTAAPALAPPAAAGAASTSQAPPVAQPSASTAAATSVETVSASAASASSSTSVPSTAAVASEVSGASAPTAAASSVSAAGTSTSIDTASSATVDTTASTIGSSVATGSGSSSGTLRASDSSLSVPVSGVAPFGSDVLLASTRGGAREPEPPQPPLAQQLYALVHRAVAECFHVEQQSDDLLFSSTSTSSQMDVETASPTTNVVLPSSVSGVDVSTQPSQPATAPSSLLPRLSELLRLDELWAVLGDCLSLLSSTSDRNAVLLLQSTVEAFFLVHGEDPNRTRDQRNRRDANALRASQQQPPQPPQQPPQPPQQQPQQQQQATATGATGSAAESASSVSQKPVALTAEQLKFVSFAEKHRAVLNQILRQSQVPLADGPFAVLVNYTHVLDFDVKRRYFRQELQRHDERHHHRREDSVPIRIRRDQVFEDSYRHLFRLSGDDWKARFMVQFEGM